MQPRTRKGFTDSHEAAAQRALLRELNKLLMTVHKSLLDATRDEYIATRGAIDGPYALLQLVMADPFFAWLRSLSSLMVTLDDMADADLVPAELNEVVGRLDDMVGGTAPSGFTPRYLEFVQRDPEIASRHGSLRRLINRLRPVN